MTFIPFDSYLRHERATPAAEIAAVTPETALAFVQKTLESLASDVEIVAVVSRPAWCAGRAVYIGYAFTADAPLFERTMMVAPDFIALAI